MCHGIHGKRANNGTGRTKWLLPYLRHRVCGRNVCCKVPYLVIPLGGYVILVGADRLLQTALGDLFHTNVEQIM